MTNSQKLIKIWIGDILADMNSRLISKADNVCIIDLLGEEGLSAGACTNYSGICRNCISAYLSSKDGKFTRLCLSEDKDENT